MILDDFTMFHWLQLGSIGFIGIGMSAERRSVGISSLKMCQLVAGAACWSRGFCPAGWLEKGPRTQLQLAKGLGLRMKIFSGKLTQISWFVIIISIQ